MDWVKPAARLPVGDAGGHVRVRISAGPIASVRFARILHDGTQPRLPWTVPQWLLSIVSGHHGTRSVAKARTFISTGTARCKGNGTNGDRCRTTAGLRRDTDRTTTGDSRKRTTFHRAW